MLNIVDVTYIKPFQRDIMSDILIYQNKNGNIKAIFDEDKSYD
ncbi:hypothetical protein [Sulfuricurvum sp.]